MYNSWEAPGEPFTLLSSLARGERLGCRGWMDKQSVNVSGVTSAVDFIYRNVNINSDGPYTQGGDSG